MKKVSRKNEKCSFCKNQGTYSITPEEYEDNPIPLCTQHVTIIFHSHCSYSHCYPMEVVSEDPEFYSELEKLLCPFVINN